MFDQLLYRKYSDMGCLYIHYSEDEIHQQVNTNLYGPIRVMKAALPFMRAQKSGTIINVSSIAGLHGRPATALYAASKFGLEGMRQFTAVP